MADIINFPRPAAGRAGKPPLELWGGYECTVNRVRDQWFDQTPRSGHEHRPGDLDLFAELGIKSLRYPALWERISPDDPESRDFRWTDERLPRIRELGMNPILTLCHHGSGPKYTDLLAENFAPGLARHAAAVAERYDWVRDWTPVNEPLTTARFSALYGYWYPHTTTEEAFWTALLNEIDATRLAMREIRKVNPTARLIQTDDLGFCHATEPLQSEADYQNERRWIGWDLLCGIVVPGHALWDRIAGFGFEERLRVIADDPCPPDVIGINHYLASERLLDHRVEFYPDRAVADRELGQCNGVPHVDVDAVRNLRAGTLGFPALLRQAWQRYARTISVTECHNGATREEQARWFVETWNGVDALRDEGVDIRAVTAWSLLGSHDWNRMVTRFIGHYEVGVYDVRSGSPRPTMMAHVLKQLADGHQPQAVGLGQPGWWARESRFGAAAPHPGYDLTNTPAAARPCQPLMIAGAGGPLAQLLMRACEVRGLHYVRATQPSEQAIRAADPWAVLDGRDWAGVCEQPAIRSYGEESAARWLFGNFAPPEALVSTCARLGLPCAVFGPASDFEEVDERLLALGDRRFILARTERVFTPWDKTRFAVRALDGLDLGMRIEADPGRHWDETYGPDLVDAVLDMAMDGCAGPLTFLRIEPWSEADFARRLAEVADCDPGLVLESRRPHAVHEAAAMDIPPLLPPAETTIERFVREARCARRKGVEAVGRRRDETRLQAAPAKG